MNMRSKFTAQFPIAANSPIMLDALEDVHFQRIYEILNSENVLFAAEGRFPDITNIKVEKFVMLWGWRATRAEIDFLEGIRQSFPNAPVLVISADDDVAARDKAFELGVDNYCAPDASLLELAAKANRLFSMTTRSDIEEVPLVIGNIKLWRAAKIVLRDGEKISLSSREFAILVALAENSPEPVSRDKLEREAFNIMHNPGTNVVAVHIHRIRLKIQDDCNLIQTVTGKGYSLVGI